MLASRATRTFPTRHLARAYIRTSYAGFHKLSKLSAQEKPHLWEKLPGENSGEKPGFSKLLGPLKENNFRNVHAKPEYDVVVVGGGIVGLATAREILNRFPEKTVVVLEKEREVAAHQTGHNSGVIHAGLYYEPGSRMAHTCVRGADLMYKYCEDHGLPVERCGKLVVAVNEKEHAQVEKLYRQGTANGVKGLKILDGEQVKEYEPNVRAYSALYSPNTGIVDFGLVAQNLAQEIKDSGRGEIKLAFEAKKFTQTSDHRVLIRGAEPANKGPALEVLGKNVITCAGFYADRVSGLAGGDPEAARVVTFRGTYYQVKPEYRGLVKMNVYPVPSGGGIPVGVHFTPTVNARRGHQLIVGPGACITFAREGYQFWDLKLSDIWDSITNPHFWSFALSNFSLSFGELWRDLNKRAFLKSGQRMIPSLREDMVEPSFAGVMAQIFEKGGVAAGDYILERKVLGGTTLNVRNAPSPACTASLAIGEMVANVASEDFGWEPATKKESASVAE
ncbi:FAD dependent oxidoreductase [Basidiobolus meristosporus CBS 931.73]|uniref:L-2-hydroxyglutarate dehydrogenase, mitochondrial n=1 Tax=Basidiobolus meristosporus CBS 931.73 TaxID=1314790 RepID=A0A1Y1XKW8_9FUNG|nr:FAD dependent oxidoreductase [Basidiobolus meristosporus CBS 931.73]|eukprot:ORX86398.1 FAD dependent oxidoreductase [Basidiobolus meristosporus CBS 931.73]